MFFTKDWIKSKTVWAGFATMVLGIIGLLFGVDTDNLGADPKEWADLFASVGVIFTGSGSIIFRLVSVAALVPKAVTEIEKVKDAVEAQKGKTPTPDAPTS